MILDEAEEEFLLVSSLSLFNSSSFLSMLTTDTDCKAAVVRDLVLSKIYAGPRYGFCKKLFEKTSEYLSFLFTNLFCLIEWMKLGRFKKRNGFLKGGK